MRNSGVGDDDAQPCDRPSATGSSVRRSLSRTLSLSSGIVTGIVKRLSRTATALVSTAADTSSVEGSRDGDNGAPAAVDSSRFREETDRSTDVYRSPFAAGGGATSSGAWSPIRKNLDKEMFVNVGSSNCFRREAVVVSSAVCSEDRSSRVSTSAVMKPTPNRVIQRLPQFRKETSFASKSCSDSISSPLNHSILPPYISPFSARFGEMPAVRLSPRPSPKPLKIEEQTRSVTVKISQPDPLKSPFQRYRPTNDPKKSQSNSYCRMSSVDTVVEALRKRKRSGIDLDDGIEVRLSEETQQPLKRRRSCDSRDSVTRLEAFSSDSAKTASSEANINRGLKRPALREELDVDLEKDSSPSANTTGKIASQKSSPVQSPLRQYPCGAKNLIDASYTSIQRFEKRLRSENCRRSLPMVFHDRNIPNAGSRMSSRQTSPASSRISSNTSQVRRGEAGSPSAPSSGPSSRRASPLTVPDKLQEPTTSQRLPLLLKDATGKNRLTVLNTSSVNETKLDLYCTQEAQTSAMLFTADDLEKDRLLLSSRADWILSEAGLIEDKPADFTFQKPPITVTAALSIPSDIGEPAIPSMALAALATSSLTSVGNLGQSTATSKAVDAFAKPSCATGAETVVDSNVLKLSNTEAPLSSVLNSSSNCTSVTSSTNDINFQGKQMDSNTVPSTTSNSERNSILAARILTPLNPPVSASCTSLSHNPSELLKSSVSDFSTGASTKLGGGDGLSDSSSKVSQSNLVSSSVLVATVSNQTSLPCISNDNSTFTTPAFDQQNVTKNVASSVICSTSSAGLPKTFDIGSSKVPVTASVVFGTHNSVLSGNGTNLLAPGANSVVGSLGTVKNLSASTNVGVENEKSGFGFANKICNLTPGTTATYGNSFASLMGSSTTTPTDTSSKFAFGNSVSTNSAACGFGNPVMTQTVASGGFSFGNSGSSTSMQNAHSSGGFAFGTAVTSVTGTKSQTVSNGGFQFAKSNIAETNVNGLGNSAAMPSTNSGGFSFASSMTMQSSGFGQFGMTNTTANSSVFGFSGTTQSSGGHNFFGNSSMTQSGSGFSFEKSVAPQAANSGFAFGASTAVQANGVTQGNLGSTSTYNNGFSTSMNAKMPDISFGKSSNTPFDASSLSGSSNAGTFIFGKSGAPNAVASAANASFVGLSSVNAFSSNAATNNVFGSSHTVSNSFGNPSATVNSQVNPPFGSYLPAVSIFGTNLGGSASFGTNPAKSTPFGSATSVASPFVNNVFGNGVNMASSASMPAFGTSGVSSGNQFQQLSSGGGFAVAQPTPDFNFLGAKASSVAVSSAGNFVFGKSNSLPAFSQNAGGFAFNQSSSNNPPPPSNQGFNFQSAMNAQTPSMGFNFSAFGQTQNVGANGMAGTVPFGASKALAPSFSVGAGTPTARTSRGRKKAGR